jgi:Domain of unknown function (DUF222)
MFDEFPDSASCADLDDAAVVAAIEYCTRTVAIAAAHRLAFIAELTSRRYDEEWDIAEDACGAWDSAAAEVSAASGISQGRASTDMEVGAALSTQLPQVGALLMAGGISEYLARIIVNRTSLVQDPELLTQLDTALTQAAVCWGGLSKKKLESAIDVLVDRYDPGALKHTRTSLRGRGIWFGHSDSGTTEISGRLPSADAALADRRLTTMATGVCKEDPRTFEQRRADALGAFGAGSFHLACLCGRTDCPNSADDGRASNVAINIYAEAAAVAAQPDPFEHGEGPLPEDDTESAGGPTTEGDSATVGDDEAEPVTAPCDRDDAAARRDSGSDIAAVAHADKPARAPAGVIPGFGIVPASLLAAMIARGAKVRFLQSPALDPEPQYRPLTALDEWVRGRDLTCRFPNCDRPAQFCDWDHTVPYPAGPTHASGGKMLCRKHHLLKTFWSGWSDVQYPDGTVVWTTPAGRAYTTKPGSSLFFPGVNTTSAAISTGIPTPEPVDKSAMMPRRKRSRARERAYRTRAERALNDAHVAERNQPPPF